MHKRAIAAAMMGLVTIAPVALAQDIEMGKQLYTDNCMSCHGSKAQGAVGMKLEGDAAYWDFPIFKRTVMQGIDDEGKPLKIMPVLAKTGFYKPQGAIPTDAQLRDIQAYLKTLGPAE